MSRAGVPWWALALAVLALVVVPGGTAVVLLAVTAEQRKVRLAAQTAGRRFGVSGAILEAIGYVESRWRMSAVNRTGADGARGGSWGPFQLSEKTARAYGYSGPMDALTQDADLAAEWAARIMAARPGGAPQNTDDAAAWWNAGRTSFAGLGDAHVTRTDYAPKARAALELVASNPVTA
ncbi:MAG: transglycosylase SLT domain-containing protein [Xanthomonadales bacterium]|nr:transglycosylase SLT domain-containing protein [Xanthomonadales bacterium]